MESATHELPSGNRLTAAFLECEGLDVCYSVSFTVTRHSVEIYAETHALGEVFGQGVAWYRESATPVAYEYGFLLPGR